MSNFNVPNTITFIRLVVGLTSIYTLVQGYTLLTLIFFLAFMLGDKLDGYLARKLKQETQFGASFDNYADFIFITAILFTLFFLDILSTVTFSGIIVSGALLAIINLKIVKKHNDWKSDLLDKLSGAIYYVLYLFVFIPVIFAPLSYLIIVSNVFFCVYRARKYL